jgi:hypothetical protein
MLMCCACGRFLPQEYFDLDHLIPRQALKLDPEVVRANPGTPANIRAGNLLLCKKPLKYKGTSYYENGCNSWKGRVYDKAISELVHGKALQSKETSELHIRAALAVAYLAMVAEFGYVVVLMQSGLLMREQFFMQNKFHPMLPTRSQMLLSGGPVTASDATIWCKPFSFGFHDRGCTVVVRSFAVTLPTTRDPRAPIARHLRIVPNKYALRPDFRTMFE